jgi:O-acetyl-ADP-ribose deacetylase (regulator of RNase III)
MRKESYPDGLPTGEAVATTAGNLPSSYVIHTVGPIYHQCAELCADLLASSYRKSLELAQNLGCKDVAFPAISTGVYGYPKDKAAVIAYAAVSHFLEENKSMQVHFVFHNTKDRDVFIKAIAGV